MKNEWQVSKDSGKLGQVNIAAESVLAVTPAKPGRLKGELGLT
jgi:hypothetical protein